jgi:hypothetical protein
MIYEFLLHQAYEKFIVALISLLFHKNSGTGPHIAAHKSESVPA